MFSYLNLSIRGDGISGVSITVDMGGTAGIVTGEDGLHVDNTVLVTGLDTAEPGSVEVGSVRGVTVAAGNNAGVDTGGVAVPEIGVDSLQGLTGVCIDQLDVHVERDALLVLDDILPDELAGNIVRTLGDIGPEDAGRIGAEKNAGIGGSTDSSQGGVVVSGQNAVQGAGVEEVSSCGNRSVFGHG